MGTGIIVCGLNGAGKSTLGKVLADRLNFHFIDSECLYFLMADPLYIYAYPRTREEAAKLLFKEIKIYKNFVLTSVKGDYGEWLYPYLQYAILIDVPKDVRIQRVKNRSFQKFGNRILPGGDLHEQEKNFFNLVQSRAEDVVEEWLQSLSCPIIQVDGTKSIVENVKLIIEQIRL